MSYSVNCRGTEEQRFWKKVRIADNGCWEWIAAVDQLGYGKFALAIIIPKTSKHVLAHRWTYTKYIGTIPDDLELDHLCRNPKCVNPLHLEAVTHMVNMLRGNIPMAKVFKEGRCFRGHLLTEDNVYRRPIISGFYFQEEDGIRDAIYKARKQQLTSK